MLDKVKNNLLLVSLWLTGLILLNTNFRIISYLILIHGLSLFIPIRPKLAGIITKVIFSFLLLTCLQQIEGLLFWKLGVNFTYFWALAPNFLLLFLLLFITKETLKVKLHFSRIELISFCVGIISIGVIAFTTLNGAPVVQQTMRYITRGFDSSTHLSLIVSVYENKGYLYGPTDKVGDKLVFKTLSAYPQGWHLTNSIIWHGVTDNLNLRTITIPLFLFFITSLFWYFLLIYLVTYLVFIFIQKLSKSPITLLDTGAAIGAVALLQLALLLGVLRYGFVNYIAITAYLLGIIVFLVAFYGYHISSRAYLLCVSLLATGIGFSWLLASPIGYIILFIPLLDRLLPIKLRRLVLLARKQWPTVLLSLIILSTVLVQVFLQVKYSVVPNNINADTGIWTTNHLFFAFLFSVFIGAVFKNKLARSVSLTMMTTNIAVAITIGLIYLYQFHSAAKIGYYSEKLNILLILVLGIFASAVLAVSLKAIRNSYGAVMSYVCLLGIIVAAPVVFGINTSESRFAMGTDRKLSLYTSSQLAGLIQSGEAHNNNIIVMKLLDYEEDVITTHFINTLSRKETYCSSLIGWKQIIRDEPNLFSTIAECANGSKEQNYYLIASSVNYDKLQSTFSNISNVKVILSN